MLLFGVQPGLRFLASSGRAWLQREEEGMVMMIVIVLMVIADLDLDLGSWEDAVAWDRSGEVDCSRLVRVIRGFF